MTTEMSADRLEQKKILTMSVNLQKEHTRTTTTAKHKPWPKSFGSQSSSS